ncbi:MAG: hypothetical protein KBA26_10375 [Candidatus Delongbacteria bacterium]|nr:hypothetical protein [Candidatus Delongbacteria bacterium]
MAVNIDEMINNLLEFYSFDNKTIISVGAGGGQFIEYGRRSKRVIAIDNSLPALTALEKALQSKCLTDKFTLIHSDFYQTDVKGDVVLFEFCLHEMEDSIRAIDHALTMAPCVVVSDHWPESEWAYIADEREKVIHSWGGLERFTFQKIQRYDTHHYFLDYQELLMKVKVQGETSIRRIESYRGRINITIPMSYGFAMIKRS